MNRPIRVLVVDDAVVVRKIVTDALSSDPGIEVCGIAANGKIALDKITQINPDILTLDIEMPEMDGLTTVREIRRLYPRLPVIMFSTLTEHGAAATLDALAAGASDYVTKPANVGGVMEAIQRIREQLIPKIKGLCSPLGATAEVPSRKAPVPTIVPTPVIPNRRASVGPLDVLAIGVSTGGPNALAALLPEIPEDFPLPIVIVQHMPPLFTKLLADRLNALCHFSVCEGEAGMQVKPGTAWIAPGGRHMALKREGLRVTLEIHDDPAENSCRPAVDVLFRSVAEVYSNRALCLVLTGMGQDGLRGSEEVCRRGGKVVVQDEETSVVWGMPGFVAHAGLADKILPLSEIAGELTRRASAYRPILQMKGA